MIFSERVSRRVLLWRLLEACLLALIALFACSADEPDVPPSANARRQSQDSTPQRPVESARPQAGSGKYPLCIAGTVTDASTGKAMDEFQVVPILYLWPGRPFVLRNRYAAEADVKKEGSGKFTVTVNTADRDIGVQVEAHGYKTARSAGGFYTFTTLREACKRVVCRARAAEWCRR
jgi:hypothetical protein